MIYVNDLTHLSFLFNFRSRVLIPHCLCFLQVLDMRSYEERQRDYAFKGHKHFYFMTLNGSEVRAISI